MTDKFLLWEWAHSQGYALGMAYLYERGKDGKFRSRHVKRYAAMAYARHLGERQSVCVLMRGKYRDYNTYGDYGLFMEWIEGRRP